MPMKKTYSFESKDFDDVSASLDGLSEDYEDEQERKEEELARQETKTICGLRVLLFLALFCSMMGVAIGSYFVSSSSDGTAWTCSVAAPLTRLLLVRSQHGDSKV